MRKVLLATTVFVCVLTVAVVSSAAMAEEQVSSQAQAEAAYRDFQQSVAPVRADLFAKQSELDALYRSGQPDQARVEVLIREIGELKARMYAARSQLDARLGDSGAGYASCGRGGFGGRCGGFGGGYGHRGGGHHGGHRW